MFLGRVKLELIYKYGVTVVDNKRREFEESENGVAPPRFAMTGIWTHARDEFSSC